ncbi:MAG: hypothetical protein KIT34_14760 [Cyanobacteria bacterium TGS_CYA1]|nr:hypothetical protein [Cyanobacteria bacterium TGS_CYA1]
MKRGVYLTAVLSLNLSCLILGSNLLLQAQEANDDAPVRDSLTSAASSSDPLDIYREAGINKDQELKIRNLAKEFEDVQRVRLKTLFGLIEDMQDFQMKPDPAEAEVMAKQTQINNLRSEIANGRIKLLLDIRAILSTEQKEKLVALLKERKAKARRRAN